MRAALRADSIKKIGSLSAKRYDYGYKPVWAHCLDSHRKREPNVCCVVPLVMPQNFNQSLTQEALLHRIANRIRQSLELQEILSTTVAEVRTYLGTDRIKIYQFQPDGHGFVVAESRQGDRLPSLLGLHFPADDIPPYARELFVQARQRTIVNLATHEVGISSLSDADVKEPGDQTDIRYHPVDPCHQEYLTAMGVKSSVVVPIVLEGETVGPYHPPSLHPHSHLWGLLISHHADPRDVDEAELQFIQAVVDQVAVAIAHACLLDQVRAQARREANINQVTARLQTSPTVDWQDALQSATDTLAAGGRLYLFPSEQLPREIYTIGEQPALIDDKNERSIEENLLLQKYLHSVLDPSVDETGYYPWSVEWMRTIYGLQAHPPSTAPDPRCWVINDIHQEPLFRTLAVLFDNTTIRSALIIPLKHGTQILGCLTFFRSGVDIETLWAGYHDPDSRQLIVRQSFEMWRQLKKNQAQHWTSEEVKYAQELGERFAATIKQYQLFQQVQQLNQKLEQRVQERTHQLRLVLAASRMAVWERDLTTKEQHWSPESYALFGFHTDEKGRVLDSNGVEISPRPTYDLFIRCIHPEDRAAVIEFGQKIAEEASSAEHCGTRFWESERRVLWPDGSVHWHYTRTALVYDEQERPTRLSGVSMDITERKQAEEQLRTSLKEKEVLLREIHHRVKNNLQIITSLLRMQSQQADDEPTIAFFKEAQNRLHSMSLIHEQLYQSPNLSSIPFGNYLHTLIRNLFRSYGISTDVIVPTIQADHVYLPVDTAIPCGLIVNELVSNILKYAFPKQQSGKILIQLHQEMGELSDAENPAAPPIITLKIADNGVGLPETLNLDQVETLGLTLVYGLANQLKGVISLDRDQGTCFCIKFPIL